MKRLPILLIVFSLVSCQFFETEKIPAEQFYEEELKTLDWNEVDQYPVFKECEKFSEKETQKSCFENTIQNKMVTSISQQPLSASQKVIDTLVLTMEISKNGKLSVKKMQMDSLLKKQFPKIESWLLQSIDSMQLIAPAYKRGIPVKTEFTLPVVLQTQ